MNLDFCKNVSQIKWLAANSKYLHTGPPHIRNGNTPYLKYEPLNIVYQKLYIQSEKQLSFN